MRKCNYCGCPKSNASPQQLLGHLLACPFLPDSDTTTSQSPLTWSCRGNRIGRFSSEGCSIDGIFDLCLGDIPGKTRETNEGEKNSGKDTYNF